MKIKSLHIKNFKSIVDLTINEPNPFTVFVGPNGSGKSNIFEALEFAHLMTLEDDFDKKYKIERQFGESESFLNSKKQKESLFVGYEFQDEVLVFNRIIKDETILAGIRQAKEQVDKNKNQIEIYLKEILEQQGLNGNAAYSLSTERFDRILSPRYDSLSFTLPVKKEKIEHLNSILDFSGNNFDFLFSDVAEILNKPLFEQFFYEFSRIFIGSRLGDRSNHRKYLKNDASNLDKSLSFILKNDNKRLEIIEWLQLFVPEFENIEFRKSQINGKSELQIFEKYSDIPFNTSLISDGTYNIIALLTAIYQSDEPQFLCIEEPENGLHPFVQKELVNFFRWACEEYGHYIWLNTHSQNIVSQLTTDEIITVNKRNGETKIQQHKNTNLHGFKVDEAWLNNVLGGGNLWS